MYVGGYYYRAQVVLQNSADHGFCCISRRKEFLSHIALDKQSHNTSDGRKLQQNRMIYRNCDTFHCSRVRALQFCMGVQ